MAEKQDYNNQNIPTQQNLMNQEQAVLTSNFVGNQMLVKQVSNPLEILADSLQAFIYQDFSMLEVLIRFL